MPDQIHNISLSFLVDKLEKQLGGTAGNIAYTLKLLGFDPYILSCAGNDFSRYREFLEGSDIDTSGIRVYKSELTSAYFVTADSEHNQIGSFFIGAMKYAKRLSLKSQKIGPEFVVISPNNPEAVPPNCFSSLSTKKDKEIL